MSWGCGVLLVWQQHRTCANRCVCGASLQLAHHPDVIHWRMKADEFEEQLASLRRGEVAAMSSADMSMLQSLTDAISSCSNATTGKTPFLRRVPVALTSTPAAASSSAPESDPKDMNGYQVLLRLTSKLAKEVRRQARERKNLEVQLASMPVPMSVRKPPATPAKSMLEMVQWKESQRLSEENTTLKQEVWRLPLLMVE